MKFNYLFFIIFSFSIPKILFSGLLEEGILAFEDKRDLSAIETLNECLSENPHHLIAKAYLYTLRKLYKKKWGRMPGGLEASSEPSYPYNPESFLGRYIQMHFIVPSIEHRKYRKKFKTTDPKARRSLEILLSEFQKNLPLYQDYHCETTDRLQKLCEKLEGKYYIWIDFDAINALNSNLISAPKAYKEEALNFIEATLYYDLLQFGFLEAYDFFYKNIEKADHFFSYLSLRKKEKSKEEIIRFLLNLYTQNSELNQSDLHFLLAESYSDKVTSNPEFKKATHFNLELNVLQYYACLGHQVALQKLIDFAQTMRRQSDLADLTHFAQTIGTEPAQHRAS